jgi:hypothetical protein
MRVGFGYYWPVCGQSSSSSESGLDPCRGAIGERPTGSHQKFIVPGQVFPRAIASHCPRPWGRGRRPEAGGRAGWGFRGTAALRGGGASALPGPHPPERCPPRSTARVSRGILRVHQNRHGGSTELAPRRSPTRNAVHHVVSLRQWGLAASPVPTPRGDSHHGPQYG